ncbi:HAD family hydrolase [Candidatus Falkowbacteria bacterium]|jgi:FMN phosphatase YigB (HAD superfamily)|nr:HAD family hydrolase [Candidatus Falkowbacteria bacterium]MBT4433573.1 HAD family hydrolase [Candidatus Falkowbacteria bacterium]
MIKIKNLFFIDFDDTLFNTKKFKKEFLKIFKQNKVSKKQFDECYYSKDKNGDLKYDIEKQIFTLQNKYGVDGKKIKKEVKIFLTKTEEFLFPDTIDFLDNLQGKDNYLVLLSYGAPVFQKKKIVSSGIVSFFQEIIISDKEKLKFIKKHPKSKTAERIFFLEDHPEQLEKCLQDISKSNNNILQKIEIIRIKRREGCYSNEKFSFQCLTVSSLREVLIKI